MPELTITVVADYACQTGEGPLWRPEERRLYWTDIPAGKLYRYDPATERSECCYQGRPVGGYTLQADGSLLLFRDRGNVVVWRDGNIERTVIEEIPELAETRFNDVVADPLGRVFCGSMSSPTVAGRLHLLDREGKLRVILTDQRTPNGMGFAPDRTALFYNDSRAARTWRFRYAEASGEISAPELLRDAREAGDPGRPDGLVVDDAGCIWTARWDGHAILRFGDAGQLLERFDIPEARNISSLTFAPRYDPGTQAWSSELVDLYVTTAGGHERAANGPAAGALLRLRFAGDPYRGQPEFRSRV